MRSYFIKTLLSAVSVVSLYGSAYSEQFDNSNYYDNQPCCDQPCISCCDSCNSFWVDAEYLYWQLKGSPNPVPFIVSGPLVPRDTPILDTPGSEVLLGRKSFKNDWRSGGRLTIGGWFDDCRSYGAEVNYFILGKHSKKQSVSQDGSAGSTTLYLPFFNVVTGLGSQTYISVPGRPGAAVLKIDNKMQGSELNGLANLGCFNAFNIKALVGFRWWNFDENLSFVTNSPIFGDPTSIFTTRDRFETKNNFYGGQIGLCLDYICNDFFVKLKGKVAFGGIEQKVNIKGSLETNALTDDLRFFQGGYFAQSTNIGKHSKTRCAVLPEVNFDIGYNITCNFSIIAGYSFLYVNKVLWAGNQIDRGINPSQSPSFVSDPEDTTLVGVARPLANLKTSSFWAQGLNVGIEYRF